MPRGKQDTSAGMVADYEAMLDFVKSTKDMMDKLTESKNEVDAALVKMGDLGNTDVVCHTFVEIFHSHATKIDELNELLANTGKYYTELADLVRDETEYELSVNVNYRRHR